MIARLLVGALILTTSPASAQTAEEAVAMMMFGSTKTTGFVHHEDIRALDRKGVSIGYYKQTESTVSITQIDKCLYEIVQDMTVTENPKIRQAGSVPERSTQKLQAMFDFSKVSVYKVQDLQSPTEAVANLFDDIPIVQIQHVLLVSIEGSKFLRLRRPELTPTWDRWTNEIQGSHVDISRLQKAHEFFRATFCPARPF